MAGYNGYSMSNNAIAAYYNGEKPLSKWNKTAIISEAVKINPEIEAALQDKSEGVLKEHLLIESSWHHISSYYNRTSFYSIDAEQIEQLTSEDIKEWKDTPAKSAKTYRGGIDYIVWRGSKRHPKAEKHSLSNVNITEKGKFYIVTDDNGVELLRKQIGTNGTTVTNYDERQKATEEAQARNAAYKANSSKEALEFYDNMNGREYSQSGHIYPKGRKPDRYTYDEGVEKFFKIGEKRIYNDEINKKYVLEKWDGHKWVAQTDTLSKKPSVLGELDKIKTEQDAQHGDEPTKKKNKDISR